MALTPIVGNDGAFTGIGASNEHNGRLNAWTLTVPRVVSPVTEFADVATRHRGGVATYTGTASGGMSFDAANTGPNIGDLDSGGADPFTPGGDTTVLTVAPVCTFTGPAIISNSAISVDKNGESTLSWDFTFDGAPAEVWDETP